LLNSGDYFFAYFLHSNFGHSAEFGLAEIPKKGNGAIVRKAALWKVFGGQLLQ
jgi:hypothetical protein